MAWAEHAEAQQAATVIVETASIQPQLPDIPPNILRCVRGPAPAKKTVPGEKPKTSADALALATIKDRDERRKCAHALIVWYRAVQGANKVAAK